MQQIHFVILLTLGSQYCQAQHDSLVQASHQLPAKYISQVSDKISSVDKKLSRQTLKLLREFEKQEAMVLEILAEKDSTRSKDLIVCSAQKIEQLQNEFVNIPGKAVTKFTGTYNAYIDTLKTSFKFLLQKEEGLIGRSGSIAGKLQQATSKLNVLERKFEKAEEITKYLRERKDHLRQELEKYGMGKELRKIEKATYYYSSYVKEYKDILRDKKKIEQKAMDLLYAVPAFKKFMSENSVLAALFKMQGADPGTNAIPTLTGVQTRATVNAIIQTSLGAGGTDAFSHVRQQIMAGQAELDKLKENIYKYGSADPVTPSFKPNNQKTRSFLKRLEYGANVQFGRSNQFMPATADIGLFAGYKINDKSSAGIAASYKLGLGSGWSNIRLSSEGLGLRSYIDWVIKENLFVSGGYEQNYNSRFKNINELEQYSCWQSSVLIGISKKLKLKGKKSAKLQVLYDFLSYRHVPVTQPFIFRTGYNFK